MAIDISTLVEKPACYPELRGQVALVTGGGTGIGRGIAIRLADEGMKVAICGRRPDPLTETVEFITARGGTAYAVPTDVGDEAAVARLFTEIEAHFGQVEALIHNAMIMKMVPLQQVTNELWEESFATSCRAAYFFTRYVVPQMKVRGRGGIVFISSVGGLRAHLPGLPYDATKGALDAMVRTLGIEVAPYHIRVNALAPGSIWTRHITPERMQSGKVPMRRHGTPAEMAAVIAFLLSDQSSYLTGQVLYVDGGTTAQLSLPGVWL